MHFISISAIARAFSRVWYAWCRGFCTLVHSFHFAISCSESGAAD